MGLAPGIDYLETAVIDEDLIAAAISEGSGPAEAEHGNGNSKGFAAFELAHVVSELTTLRLSYKNILKIDNLQGLASLTKLCLDNNIIERIANLSHLVHLRWLDLSFNNIRKIEGLESLTELEDLSLYNNQLTTVEGLQCCTKLQCLSLGNNKITALDSIIKLRASENLQLVNLDGNPICKEQDYRFVALAYLKNLKYLDFVMVEQSEVLQAREQYQDELLELDEKVALEVEKLAREAALAAEEAELKAANLLVVKTLFNDMLGADTEMSKLKHLPGINDIVEQLKTHITAATESFRVAGMEKIKEKRAQVEAFDKTVSELRKGYSQRNRAMIEEFDRKKKRTFKILASKETMQPSDLAELLRELEQLQTALMDQEMYQVEQHTELLNEFEGKYSELRNQCYELQQSFFRACEEHEENYFTAVGQLAQDILEKGAKNELPDDIPDELGNLIIDRDTCMNSAVGSHDIHVGKLLAREDEARAAEAKEMIDIVEGRSRAELSRNRASIMELRELFETNRAQINELISSKVADDFDNAEGM